MTTLRRRVQRRGGPMPSEAVGFLRRRLSEIEGAQQLLIYPGEDGLHAVAVMKNEAGRRQAIDAELDLIRRFPGAALEVTVYLTRDLGPRPEDARVGALASYQFARAR